MGVEECSSASGAFCLTVLKECVEWIMSIEAPVSITMLMGEFFTEICTCGTVMSLLVDFKVKINSSSLLLSLVPDFKETLRTL